MKKQIENSTPSRRQVITGVGAVAAGIAAPILGATVCTAALAIGLAGVREFHRHQTPTSPFKPTTALVTSGVFGRTRNPMYLGLVLLVLAIAVSAGAQSEKGKAFNGLGLGCSGEDRDRGGEHGGADDDESAAEPWPLVRDSDDADDQQHPSERGERDRVRRPADRRVR